MDDKLTFDFDYSIFMDEGTKSFIEVYYSFDPSELVFSKTTSGFEASGKISFEVIDNNAGKIIVLKDFKVPVVLADTSNNLKNFKLTGQFNMSLDSGSYKFNITASDFSDSSRSASLSEDIRLRPFTANKVNMSTVQLSTGIYKSNDTENIFYKNSLEVTPNPSTLFGNNLSKLYYYIELYNLNSGELGDKYSLDIAVVNQDHSEIKSIKKDYDVKSGSKVEFGTVGLEGLPSNKYLLLVKLNNSSGEELIRAFKYFYIYNSDTSINTQNLTDLQNEFLLSEYPKMEEKDVDIEFSKAIYLISDIQREQYESLKSLDDKRLFMYKFWKGISSILTKKEYFSRTEYANKNFKSDFRDGWKTDRGRIYSIYGKYDEIERFPYQGSTRAYEVWTYNKLQGGAVFVFIDMSAGFGDYTLVHSTVQNEISDENWHNKLDVR